MSETNKEELLQQLEAAANRLTQANHAMIAKIGEIVGAGVSKRSWNSTVLVCTSAEQSVKAMGLLMKYGFTNHICMQGHFVREHWYIPVMHPDPFSNLAA